MKTHIDNTIEERLKEMSIKYQIKEFGKYIDGEIIAFKWVDLFEMVNGFVEVESKRYADERVRELENLIKSKFMDVSSEDAEDWSLISMSYRQFDAIVDDFLNQNTESNEDKERDSE